MKLDMENDSENITRTRFYYRPSEDDFSSILDRLKAQRIKRTLEFANSPTSLDEGNETKQEKQERLRQEALQRDQYILSMRPNRHVVFAAKFAKVKNQGLAKRFENQVHVWNQEMERKFRLVGANEKALEKELSRMRKKEDCCTIARLQASYPPGEKLKHSRKRRVKQATVKLPKLETTKDASDTGNDSSKSNGHDIEPSRDNSVKFPPIKSEQTQKTLSN